MGFSLVSAAEIMYFCCKKQPNSLYQKLCEIRKRRRKRSTKNGSIPTSRGETIANSLNFDNIEANFRSIDDAESAWNIYTYRHIRKCELPRWRVKNLFSCGTFASQFQKNYVFLKFDSPIPILVQTVCLHGKIVGQFKTYNREEFF